MGFLPENQVRARLPAGGNRIRTIGSAGGARHPRGRRVTFPLTFPRGGINQKRHEPALNTWSPHAGPMVRIRLPPAGSQRRTPLVVPLQHRFPGTSRSRHRARFIPMPASAGWRSRTSPQSSHRLQKQRPIRNHRRLSALSDLRTHGYSRSDAKSP